MLDSVEWSGGLGYFTIYTLMTDLEVLKSWLNTTFVCPCTSKSRAGPSRSALNEFRMKLGEVETLDQIKTPQKRPKPGPNGKNRTRLARNNGAGNINNITSDHKSIPICKKPEPDP